MLLTGGGEVFVVVYGLVSVGACLKGIFLFTDFFENSWNFDKTRAKAIRQRTKNKEQRIPIKGESYELRRQMLDSALPKHTTSTVMAWV